MNTGQDSRALIAGRGRTLNAFVEVLDPPEDLDPAGPLGATTVAVKDCFYDAGRIPTMGSRVHPPAWDGMAEVLLRLRAAGLDLVGYTNLHEWAIGGTSTVTATGPIRNPWDTSLVAGGSSGGSAAALAAGLVTAAVGTDTGGSIRIPSACCGVVGLKPTQGRVPTRGYVGDGGPTDQVGPMARSLSMTRRLFEVLIGEAVAEVKVGGLRIGIGRGHPFDNIHSDVGAAYESAVATVTGLASTVDVEVPGWDEQWWANSVLFISHTGRQVAAEIDSRPEEFHPDALRVLEWGLSRPDALLEQMREVKVAATRQWSSMFDDIDVLVTPTLPSLPPPIEDLQIRLPEDVSSADAAFGRLCGPMNLTGVPCLSLPCAQVGPLTVSMSLTARAGRDDVVLALGRAFEDATDRAWVDRVAELIAE
ncbi:MAG: aspartyl-tRNA(Asn)/glutamyl-tRNA(Gln) amidotransferase subunit [Actinomycetota bacterium]|nr:aspartyl-tRNA(Asn)/glutamyl-tRNA(Gln) amidotransferase subunit [Actinomycetota bacterium]